MYKEKTINIKKLNSTHRQKSQYHPATIQANHTLSTTTQITLTFPIIPVTNKPHPIITPFYLNLQN